MEKGRPPGRLRHSWEARCRLVQLIFRGWQSAGGVRACGASRATAYRLLAPLSGGRLGGAAGSAADRQALSAPAVAEAEAQIVALRRQTGWGPRSLSAALGRPASTIWRVLKRHGCSRAQRQPRPPANRYEYDAPGELVHLDIKKLGRFWQVGKARPRGRRAAATTAPAGSTPTSPSTTTPATPSSSCAAPSRPQTAPPSLAAVIAAYAERGTPIQRILTDNGAGYRSHAFRDLLHEHGIRHIRTRPYTPRTNGKAEAFIRILQREWAYGLHLPLQRPPRPSPPRLPALVQQAPTTRRHRRPPTHQPRLTRCEALHLAIAAVHIGASCRSIHVPALVFADPDDDFARTEQSSRYFADHIATLRCDRSPLLSVRN